MLPGICSTITTLFHHHGIPIVNRDRTLFPGPGWRSSLAIIIVCASHHVTGTRTNQSSISRELKQRKRAKVRKVSKELLLFRSFSLQKGHAILAIRGGGGGIPLCTFGTECVFASSSDSRKSSPSNSSDHRNDDCLRTGPCTVEATEQDAR